jgi:hypothetical protein
MVSGFPGFDRSRRILDGDKNNPPDPEAQQVFRDSIAGAPVIDADQVVSTSFRVGDDGAIQQDERDTRIVECLRDLPVDGVLTGRQFERREEDTRHSPVDVLATELPRAFLFRGVDRRQ